MTSLRPSDAAAVLAGAASLLLASCDNGCEQLRESYPTASFVSTSGRTLRQVDITYLGSKEGLKSPAIRSLDNVDLDINPSADSTRMLIVCDYSDYGDRFTTTDTLTLYYTVEPRFLDMACGCTVSYEITEATTTHHLLDRIIINERHVTPDTGLNLTIEY